MNKVVMMMKAFLCLCLLAVAGSRLRAADAKAVYENNFTAAAVDKVPDDMLVLDGGFAVKEEAGNKFLELPGAPLETYGVLFGPTEAVGLSVRASVQSTGKGRRFPTFAVGLNGVGGYKLQASPTKKLIELYKGEEVLTNAPLQWESGSWLVLRLQSRKVKDGEIRIEGKYWKQGDAEPKDWQITRVETSEAPPGRPSVWGMPFAGTPIRYDDLVVTRAEP
ncbi:MAG TPA: hypothetical protein VNH84_17185 [Candidatus Saccharimonadales bacterium]|nr:hypothetical protein [Candidatus Saccharimonadales bacterium]